MIMAVELFLLVAILLAIFITTYLQKKNRKISSANQFSNLVRAAAMY